MERETLAIYLVALAILQGNGVTYVNKEIAEALEMIQYELRLK